MQLQHKPTLQIESRLSKPLPRPALIARWEVENNKLVCRWVMDDSGVIIRTVHYYITGNYTASAT